jgi:hypothetical protein
MANKHYTVPVYVVAASLRTSPLFLPPPPSSGPHSKSLYRWCRGAMGEHSILSVQYTKEGCCLIILTLYFCGIQRPEATSLFPLLFFTKASEQDLQLPPPYLLTSLLLRSWMKYWLLTNKQWKFHLLFNKRSYFLPPYSSKSGTCVLWKADGRRGWGCCFTFFHQNINKTAPAARWSKKMRWRGTNSISNLFITMI